MTTDGISVENPQKAYELTEAVATEAARVAATFKVSPALDERDHLLGHSINKMKRPPLTAAKGYIVGGHHDAAQVKEQMDRLGLGAEHKRILEFACGYGRVTRHLKVLAHESLLYASDIHPEACAFVEEKIGVVARQSTVIPQELDVGRNYDFIFVLSLFSHLPERTFGPWLSALYGILNPGGALLFTVHGQFALDRLHPSFTEKFYEKEKGFGFRPSSEQHDLDASEYGTAVACVNFVSHELAHFAVGCEIESFRSGVWFGLQDEWIIMKPRPAGPGNPARRVRARAEAVIDSG
jgi:SAM-dependent methyltransferase